MGRTIAKELEYNKKNDYDVKLCEFTNSIVGQKFVWGETHCIALVFKCIDAICGTNYFEWHKETHNVKSLEDAKKLCNDREALECFNDMGFMEIDIHSIQSGDIIYAFKDNLECTEIYDGSNFISINIDEKCRVLPYEYYMKFLNKLDVDYKVFTFLHRD